MKKNEQRLRTMWDIINCTNMHLMGVQERNKKTYFKKMVNIFPNLLKNINYAYGKLNKLQNKRDSHQ